MKSDGENFYPPLPPNHFLKREAFQRGRVEDKTKIYKTHMRVGMLILL
nr:MAG TPA: hypothetical protein [Caudoviricetes sp.]